MTAASEAIRDMIRDMQDRADLASGLRKMNVTMGVALALLCVAPTARDRRIVAGALADHHFWRNLQRERLLMLLMERPT